MNEKQLHTHLETRIPDRRPFGSAEPLQGGLLNLAWRVTCRDGSLVVKHSPPHIASAPDVPLDPSRLTFEARALCALAPGGRLAHLAQGCVRPPRPLDFCPESATLVMEDVGRLPHLGHRWSAPEDDLPAVASALGGFVGGLHAASLEDTGLAREFDNQPVQRTRHEVQYLGAGERLHSAGVEDWEALGHRARDLGERLQRPGRCLVMGDLWPPSVLLSGNEARLIDWEFAHFGQPAQDLGHLAAHLWMHRHRAPDDRRAERVRAFWRTFLAGYRAASGGSAGALLDRSTRRDAALHCGAEILARTFGPFRRGYLYDGLPEGSAALREATGTAACQLREGGSAPDLDALV